LLQDRRAIATYLEAQQIKVKAEVAELEEELASFRIEDRGRNILLPRAMDTSKILPPIDRLPVEILCLTFERYLISRHPSIRILLLVCKRWNQIISTTPRLWARIEVGDAFELFDFYDLKSRLPYISACIERSGDALLDVELDMRRLPTREGYIKAEMERVALSLLEDDEIDAALDIINEQSYTAISPFPQLDAAIQLLIGQDCSSLKRWRTLRIQFPHNTQARVTWEALTGDTTNLTTIHLENVSTHWVVANKLLSFGGVNLSRIQRMSLDEAIPIHHFSVSPKVLQHLKISVDGTLQSIEKLSSFPLLCTLDLSCQEDYDEDDSPKTPTPSLSIHLPQLKKLVISGEYFNLKHVGRTKVTRPGIEPGTLPSLVGCSEPPRQQSWCSIRRVWIDISYKTYQFRSSSSPGTPRPHRLHRCISIAQSIPSAYSLERRVSQI
jgi:F-box-like